MTAEIVVMNKDGIALAADSAVTVMTSGPDDQELRREPFSPVNKLFPLSKESSVGMMFYGSAQFMGIPLETIANMFKEELGDTTFDTLEEYHDLFCWWLSQNDQLFGDEARREFKGDLLLSLTNIYEMIQQGIGRELNQLGINDPDQIRQFAFSYIMRFHEQVEDLEEYDEWLEEDWEDFRDQARNAAEEYFGIFDFTEDQMQRTAEIFDQLVLKPVSKKKAYYPLIPTTGVVITGFGDREIFPHLESFLMEGVIQGTIKTHTSTSNAITHQNPSAVHPFGSSPKCCVKTSSCRKGLSLDQAALTSRSSGSSSVA